MVGSSPYQSSPTSASAMARRMAGDGLVTVSDRRSTTPVVPGDIWIPSDRPDLPRAAPSRPITGMSGQARGRPGVMTFEDTLAAWLPTQRWYSGTATVRELSITADTTLAAGDPELRHLIVTVSSGGQTARYQVLVGIR